MSWSFRSLGELAQIILVNAVLSGDNAMVIALVARHLPPGLRRRAMLWGSGLAVVLITGLTFGVSVLLEVPGLRFAGAVALAVIACKLVQEEAGAEAIASAAPAPPSFRTAIVRIAVADLVMSLDNVMAIAGISHSHPVLLVLGMAASIAMVLMFSSLIVVLLNRVRWVVYAGTAVLAVTAAGMIGHDLEVLNSGLLARYGLRGVPAWTDWGLRVAVVGACLTANRWWPWRLARPGSL